LIHPITLKRVGTYQEWLHDDVDSDYKNEDDEIFDPDDPDEIGLLEYIITEGDIYENGSYIDGGFHYDESFGLNNVHSQKQVIEWWPQVEAAEKEKKREEEEREKMNEEDDVSWLL